MNGDLMIHPASGYVVAVLSNFDPPQASSMAAFVGLRLPSEHVSFGSKAVEPLEAPNVWNRAESSRMGASGFRF
jgi:hypothetical protein